MNPRCQARRRNKRVVLTAIASMLLLQAGFSFIMSWWHPDTEYRVRKETLQARIAERPDEPLLLMIGSSQVAYAFDPERIQNLNDDMGRKVLSFNFGHLGSGPVSNLLQVKRLLRADVKPRYLIVEVNPALCYRDLDWFVSHSSWGDIETLSRYKRVDRVLTYLWHSHVLAPWFKHRVELQERYLDKVMPAKGPAEINPYGWLLAGVEIVAPQDRARMIKNERDKYLPFLDNDFRVTPATAQAYRELLALCRERDIQIALILMPKGETSRAWHGPHVEEHLQAFLRQLTEEFRVPIFDSRYWFDDSLFCDSIHMSRPGARQFTDRFERECLRPWLQRTSYSRTAPDLARNSSRGSE